MVKIKNVLFGLLFVAVGLGVAGFGVYTGYVQVKDVNSAVETTEGTIMSSTVTEAEEYEEGETEIEYYPRVGYEYTVNGETYSGERIFSQLDRSQEEGELAGKEYDNPNRAREVAGSFRTDARATVYYYPGDPARSFLVKPTVSWPFVAGAGLFGLVFALAGLGAMFSDD